MTSADDSNASAPDTLQEAADQEAAAPDPAAPQIWGSSKPR